MNDRHLRLGRPPRPVSGKKIPPMLRAYVMERDNFTCRRCGTSVNAGVRLVVDHIVPFSRGGRTEEKNCQTLCNLCNGGKSDTPPAFHDMRDP